MAYIARRYMRINGRRYAPGEVVSDAEKLRKFRTLVSAGWLVKVQNTQPAAPPPPVPPSADSSKVKQFTTEEPLPVAPSGKQDVERGGQGAGSGLESSKQGAREVDSDDMVVQRESSRQPEGRSEVRDRRYKPGRPADIGRGDKLLSSKREEHASSSSKVLRSDREKVRETGRQSNRQNKNSSKSKEQSVSRASETTKKQSDSV